MGHNNTIHGARIKLLPTPRRLAPKADTPTEPKDVRIDGRRASRFNDALVLVQSLLSERRYSRAKKKVEERNAERPPLENAPKVKLEDPFLIVPGYRTKRADSKALVDHLISSGENGSRPIYIQEDKAFTDMDCSKETQLRPDDRVFVAIFDEDISAPKATAPQLGKMVSRMKAEVSQDVDVLPYSMGGLVTREMLNESTQTLDQVVFLGTPHRGTRFSTLARYVIQRDIGFAMKIGNIGPAHLPALTALQPWDGTEESNPDLHELNTNVSKQLSQVNEAQTLGIEGVSTIAGRWRAAPGDGRVTRESLDMPGIPSTVVEKQELQVHGKLLEDPDVFGHLVEAFGWEITDSHQ